MDYELHIGDALDVLRTMPDESIQCCVTSPPYWGLRDYGVEGQLGLEPTPEEYVAKMVDVFREVRRALKADGTCWVNLGDSYTGSGKGGNPEAGKQATNKGSQTIGTLYGKSGELARQAAIMNVSRQLCSDHGMKPKDLVGIPWRVAFALQADGWYLRQDIIWHKPNPMPESVTDRCTKAHEYLFLLTKSARYYYDAEAICEPVVKGGGVIGQSESGDYCLGTGTRNDQGRHLAGGFPTGETRNRRSVWTIPTMPTKEAHFATFPEALVEPCIIAGSKPGDRILDPFGGSGTTGIVAIRTGRFPVLIELNPTYADGIARPRMDSIAAQGDFLRDTATATEATA